MAQATTLAGENIAIFDTFDTPDGAKRAAQAALANGAKILFGPLTAAQTRSVLAIAGKTPVVTFSNDETLTEDGAYVFGITATQSANAVLTYARSRNIRSFAILADDTPFGRASAVAAQTVAMAGGLTVTATLIRDPDQGSHFAAIMAASGGVVPEAVYIPEGGTRLKSFSKDLGGKSLLVMGSLQWGADELAPRPELDGAIFAAPPPDVYDPFVASFADRFGTTPGVVTALAYDAALIGAGLSAAGTASHRGLQRKAGFSGALGAFSFDKNRRCLRNLAVLGLRSGQVELFADINGA